MSEKTITETFEIVLKSVQQLSPEYKDRMDEACKIYHCLNELQVALGYFSGYFSSLKDAERLERRHDENYVGYFYNFSKKKALEYLEVDKKVFEKTSFSDRNRIISSDSLKAIEIIKQNPTEKLGYTLGSKTNLDSIKEIADLWGNILIDPYKNMRCTEEAYKELLLFIKPLAIDFINMALEDSKKLLENLSFLEKSVNQLADKIENKQQPADSPMYQ